MAIILTSAKFDWIDWDLSGGGLPMFIPIPFANTSNGWSGPNPWQSVPVAEKELEPCAADLHLPYHRSSTISFGIAMSTACQRKNLRGLVQWYSMVFHGIPWYSGYSKGALLALSPIRVNKINGSFTVGKIVCGAKQH